MVYYREAPYFSGGQDVIIAEVDVMGDALSQPINISPIALTENIQDFTFQCLICSRKPAFRCFCGGR